MLKTDLTILKDHLRHAPSRDFLLMAWALYMLWRGEVGLAGRAIEIPPEISEQRKKSRFIVPPWETVGLLSIYLEAYDNLTDSSLKPKTLAVKRWGTIGDLYNQFRNIANHQSLDGVGEEPDAVLEMMPRIMWQQFIWQQGHDNTSSIVRSAYINFGPQARSVFKKKYKLSAEKFFTISFILRERFKKLPYFSDLNYFASIGITKREIDTYFKITARTPKAASKQEKGIPGLTRDRVDFRENRIYDFPLFNVGDDLNPIYMCPFPELLVYRATYFIYFDVMGAESKRFDRDFRKEARDAKGEMDKRFEDFCVELTSATLSGSWIAEGDFQYGPRRAPNHSSDVMISCDEQIQVIAECKAKKMKIDIRLSPRPVRDHLEQIKDISNGMVQLWRYARDLREGKVNKNGKTYTAADNLSGALITLEEWADHNHIFFAECLNGAKILNNENQGTSKYVKPEDRIAVCIISALQYEKMLSQVPSCELQSYLKEFADYQASPIGPGFEFSGTIDKELHKAHPLGDRLNDFLPWVQKVKDLAEVPRDFADT
ncbi:hypothetical protein [Pseudophaeobacter sp.]|uniref:hypothetical protein n=1 Tax=Pseudophaeobacter sp. TaxID=1971739 RepID=UPI0025F62BFD|nr:hypothetical protein [uncultured Pseudophaeobacter sp.]